MSVQSPADTTEATAPLILHADDNDTARYAVSRTLRHAGFRVVEAANGEDTVALARERRPDLIVLDLNLPDISGFEVCQRLRADPETASVPVLHLTATYPSTEKWAAALEQGADAYLAEPVEPTVLVATVRALLRTRTAEAEVRRAAERWQTTFDAIPYGIAYVDASGTILRCNRAFADLHRLQPAELVGARLPPLPGVAETRAGWPFERRGARCSARSPRSRWAAAGSRSRWTPWRGRASSSERFAPSPTSPTGRAPRAK